VSLTPVEIRHVEPGRRLLGYDRKTVDRLLDDVVSSFEQVWRERADLRDEMEELQAELTKQKEIEVTLRNTLLSAERMADDVRGHARREADVIVSEARSTAWRATPRSVTPRIRLPELPKAADILSPWRASPPQP
jgi:cell division initiation protein